MVSRDEVRRLATALPEVTEREAHDGRAWRVRREDVARERPLRAADLAAPVRLDRVDPGELEELLVDAWLASAPRRLAAAHLDALRPGRP